MVSTIPTCEDMVAWSVNAGRPTRLLIDFDSLVIPSQPTILCHSPQEDRIEDRYKG